MKYEYYIVHIAAQQESGILENLGNQGWELVAVRENIGCPVFYFKRPKGFSPPDMQEARHKLAEAIKMPVEIPAISKPKKK